MTESKWTVQWMTTELVDGLYPGYKVEYWREDEARAVYRALAASPLIKVELSVETWQTLERNYGEDDDEEF